MPVYSGDRLRQARLVRYKTSKELSETLGWNATRLTRAEQADWVELSQAEAETLERYLRFSEEFFTTNPDPAICDSDLLFRAPKRMTKREKTYLAEFARLAQRFVNELDERHRLPPVRLPATGTDIQSSAEAARASLQLGADEPIGHLMHSLERGGVVIIVRPTGLSPEDESRFDDGTGNRHSEVHHGYSTWVGWFRDRPLIVTRSSSSWERTRWTTAHELGHLLMHRLQLPETAESDASMFASEFRAPIEMLKKEVEPAVTLASLIPVKQKWGISLGALLHHLASGGIINETRYDALRTQLYTRRNHETGRTWGLDEPGWKERTPGVPGSCLPGRSGFSVAQIQLSWRQYCPFFPLTCSRSCYESSEDAERTLHEQPR